MAVGRGVGGEGTDYRGAGQETSLVEEEAHEAVTAGDHISKSKIPDSLRKEYGIDNLWRIELPEGWRALYTVISRPSEETTVSILRILSHKEYDRLFGYSTS